MTYVGAMTCDSLRGLLLLASAISAFFDFLRCLAGRKPVADVLAPNGVRDCMGEGVALIWSRDAG